LSSELLIAAPLRIEARGLRAGAQSARVVRTGMGPARSRRAAERLARDPASCLAVAGFAGALDERARPGDVVIASALSAAETCAAVPLERPPLETPRSEALASCLEARGFRVHTAPLVSMPKVVKGAERTILAGRGFAAVDMESAWLAQGATGRPVAVVRIIIDGPRHEIARPAFLAQMFRAYRGLAGIARSLEEWMSEEGR